MCHLRRTRIMMDTGGSRTAISQFIDGAASFAVVGSMIAGIVAISRITGLRILGHRA